jgi:ABC-type nitrate/sulfonate/bicarbonate transport system substrate-binding protein
MSAVSQKSFDTGRENLYCKTALFFMKSLSGGSMGDNKRFANTLIHIHFLPFHALRRCLPRAMILWIPFLLSLFPVSMAWPGELLRISVSETPLSLPFYVAQSQDYFTAEGVKVRINDVLGGHRSLQQLLEGTADLATSSEAVVMFNSFQHSDFAVIASFVTSDDDVKIITRADTRITVPEQLGGKLVGTVTGAASHYFLETLLLLKGVDPASVRLRNLQPEQMAQALKSREVDAIAIWEPYPFKALKTVPGARMLPKSGIYRLTFNLIADRKLLGSRDNDLVKILRALDRAEQFISAEPQKAKAILQGKLKLDNAYMDWIWPRYSYRLLLDQSLLGEE